MILNPHAQTRAQKELDVVVGSSRLPDFADRNSLPYVNAVFTEALRWNPATPLYRPWPLLRCITHVDLVNFSRGSRSCER